jgi:hypothetical protein
VEDVQCRPAGVDDFPFLATMLGDAAVWRPDKPTPSADQVMADPRYAIARPTTSAWRTAIVRIRRVIYRTPGKRSWTAPWSWSTKSSMSAPPGQFSPG